MLVYLRVRAGWVYDPLWDLVVLDITGVMVTHSDRRQRLKPTRLFGSIVKKLELAYFIW